MNKSKIQLSEEEMQLVQNSRWILTKHGIIDKVYELFGELSLQMQETVESLQHLLPAEAMQTTPKISKGEQYERLPYVVLDYPRVFSKDDVLAVRTFFWWGNYFSCTLHLKGKFANRYYQHIYNAWQHQDWGSCYVSVQGNEFNFNLTHQDYQAITDKDMRDSLQDAAFIKISCRHSLTHWDAAPERLMEAFRKFISVIAH